MQSPTAELKYLHSTVKLGTDWIESRSSEGYRRILEDNILNMTQQCISVGFCVIIWRWLFPLNLLRHHPPTLDWSLNVRCLQIRASTFELITWCPPPFTDLEGSTPGEQFISTKLVLKNLDLSAACFIYYFKIHLWAAYLYLFINERAKKIKWCRH